MKQMGKSVNAATSACKVAEGMGQGINLPCCDHVTVHWTQNPDR